MARSLHAKSSEACLCKRRAIPRGFGLWHGSCQCIGPRALYFHPIRSNCPLSLDSFPVFRVWLIFMKRRDLLKWFLLTPVVKRLGPLPFTPRTRFNGIPIRISEHLTITEAVIQ